MAETKIPNPDEGASVRDAEAQARRDFLKKIGAAGAALPAASLILAANAKAASAQVDGYGGDGVGLPT